MYKDFVLFVNHNDKYGEWNNTELSYKVVNRRYFNCLSLIINSPNDGETEGILFS